jgi:hypothetical protein
MKNIIAAVLIATSTMTLTTTPAYAVSSTQECKTYGESVNLLADLRDKGITADVVYDFLVETGIEPELVLAMIEVVYLHGADVNPNQLERMFVIQCIKDLV